MMKNLLSGLMLVVSGNVLADEAWRVETQIYQDQVLIASPVLVVRDDETAAIQLDDQLRLELKVHGETGTEDAVVTVSSLLALSGESYSPMLAVPVGKQASVEMGRMALQMKVSPVLQDMPGKILE